MTQIRGRAKPARLLRDSWSLTSPQSGHRPSGTGLPLRVTTRRIRARGPAVNGPTQYWWCATLERVCRGHDRNGCRAVRHVQPPQEVGHVLLCRRGRDAERSRDLFVRGAARDENDDFALTWRERQRVRRAQPAAVLDERREHATRIRVLAAHRAEDRAAECFARKVRIDVAEGAHRDGMRRILWVRIRRQDDRRHALGELADQRPIRLVVRSHDREADISLLDFRRRSDAPERNAEVECAEKTEDSTRAIEDEHTRSRDRREVHTLYSPPN